MTTIDLMDGDSAFRILARRVRRFVETERALDAHYELHDWGFTDAEEASWSQREELLVDAWETAKKDLFATVT